MDAEELMWWCGEALAIDLPLLEKQVLTNELFKIVCRENRVRAEQQGIGTELSPSYLQHFATLEQAQSAYPRAPVTADGP
jgi:hypothetical protein